MVSSISSPSSLLSESDNELSTPSSDSHDGVPPSTPSDSSSESASSTVGERQESVDYQIVTDFLLQRSVRNAVINESHRAAWHVRVLDGVIAGMMAGHKVLEGGFDFSLFKGFTDGSRHVQRYVQDDELERKRVYETRRGFEVWRRKIKICECT
jgi:hypothetical protein